MANTWIGCLPSKYLYANYDLDIADHLHGLELNYLMNGGTLSIKELEWAKENVPNIIRDTITNIIIELVLLVKFVFLIINFIAGSTINDIIKATKKGI